MIRRRPARFAITAIVLAILIAEIVHFIADEPQRFREVYRGAVQTAYPEYFIEQSSHARIDPISTEFSMAALPYGSGKNDQTPHDILGQVSVNVIRRVHTPPLPDTKMTALLRSFNGGNGADETAKARAKNALDDLSENAFANAIIELTTPLSEQQLTNGFAGSFEIQSDAVFLFLSGRAGGMKKPVYWRACAVYAVDCKKRSSVELYRRWVSRITWLDRIGFMQLGLNVDQLQRSAQEGRIYGLLTYGFSKPTLVEILNHPEVRAIRISRAWEFDD
ncbi:hypothetical protein AB0C27_09895 [Nonomuraea sp. NPDC048882]|uniref:hypothetical protein n=1 Tax=Nonomuraea sp. NPDC048882 TaxID=3154347 RepID=UPI0033F66B27